MFYDDILDPFDENSMPELWVRHISAMQLGIDQYSSNI